MFCSGLGRILLICTLVLVVIMPWTEYFWHFDRFLHGGEDLELSLLALLAAFCLMLVLLQHGKRNIQLCLKLSHLVTVLLGSKVATMMPDSPSGLNAPRHAVPLPSVMLDKYNLPLQV
jgi:hypothetical protein